MNSSTYVYILKDVLKKKEEVLDKIISLVNIQENYLRDRDLDIELFDTTIEDKEVQINKLNELDAGFEKIYDRVKSEIIGNKELFQKDIIELQDLIRRLTEKSILIQSIEKKNKEVMSLKMAPKKREVKEFKANTNMVSKYYKNMSSDYIGDSHFIDKKK